MLETHLSCVLNNVCYVVAREDRLIGVSAICCDLFETRDLNWEALAIRDVPMEGIYLQYRARIQQAMKLMIHMIPTFTRDMASKVRLMSFTGKLWSHTLGQGRQMAKEIIITSYELCPA